MRKGRGLVVTLAFLFGAGLSLTVAGNLPEIVTINNQYTAKKKGPVQLSHKKHAVDYKVACIECHHEWNQKEGTQPKKCADCHKEQKTGQTPELMRAYHKNCMDCHKELQKAGKPTGPTTKCNDCHQQKS